MLPLKNEIHHVCQLDVVPDRIASKLHPNSGRLEKFFDMCRYAMLLSPANHRSKLFFRSRYAVMKERQRHLTTPRFHYTIHPFSKFAKIREVAMTCLWSVLLFLDPLMATFMLAKEIHYAKRQFLWSNLAQGVLGCVAGLDIITNFFLGYDKKQTREVILDPRKIVKRYVLTYFIFDLAALAKTLLVVSVRTSVDNLGTNVIFHHLYVFRLARLGSLSNYFLFTLKLMKVNDSAAQCIDIIRTTLFILHWWTCMLCLLLLVYAAAGWDMRTSWTVQADVTLADNKPLGYTYVRFLLIVMCHFYGASRASFWANNPSEMIVLSLIIVSGIAFYTYAIAVVGQLFRTANISETKYDELITQVNGYALDKKLPKTLKNRLLLYYESKFQRKFFQEETILQSLSEHLRLEVMLYSCKHLIESVHVFSGLSKSAVGTMLSLLKQEIFLPGDKITSSSEIHNELYYFVSYGTVACVMMQVDKITGKREKIEVMHLEDGDHFGESRRNRKLNEVSEMFYTVAIELTEIFRLPKKKMVQCKEMFPDFSVKVEKIHQKRKEYIMTFLRLRKEKTHEDILKELSYGRILLPGRKRTLNF